MIKGLGTDIVAIARIEQIYLESSDAFAARILTTQEQQDLAKTKQKAAFLAKRFAAKEAAAKALGTGIAEGVSFHDFSVEHDALGAPQLVVSGKAKELAKQLKIAHWHISISDEKAHAVATVIAESK